MLKETNGFSKEELLNLYNQKVEEKGKPFKVGVIKEIILDDKESIPELEIETRLEENTQIN